MMVTEERKYLDKVHRLRDIQVSTLSPSFKKLSKNNLIGLLNESNELILKIGGNNHGHIFKDIESRINERLNSITSLKRFVLQISLSIVILLISIFSLYLKLTGDQGQALPTQQQKQQLK